MILLMIRDAIEQFIEKSSLPRDEMEVVISYKVYRRLKKEIEEFLPILNNLVEGEVEEVEKIYGVEIEIRDDLPDEVACIVREKGWEKQWWS